MDQAFFIIICVLSASERILHIVIAGFYREVLKYDYCKDRKQIVPSARKS
jgi:hypothetical protein